MLAGLLEGVLTGGLPLLANWGEPLFAGRAGLVMLSGLPRILT
jgi:hypothetical protein